MRNLYKPNRYKVAGVQAQQTLGGDVMQADEEGDYVEFRDYRRALDEIEMMKHTIKYWEIEAQTDHARWLRVMEDYDRLKDKSSCQAECLDAYDVKLSQAEAEVNRLKAEVERLRKAGDWMYNAVILNSDLEMDKAMDAWNAAKEGKQSV